MDRVETSFLGARLSHSRLTRCVENLLKGIGVNKLCIARRIHDLRYITIVRVLSEGHLTVHFEFSLLLSLLRSGNQGVLNANHTWLFSFLHQDGKTDSNLNYYSIIIHFNLTDPKNNQLVTYRVSLLVAVFMLTSEWRSAPLF